MSLANQTIIITGASSGIGEATARLLAAEGANVVLAARRKERLLQLQTHIQAGGGQALIVETDVSRRDHMEALAHKTLEAFSGIDALVNNAGLMPLSFIKNLHVEEWEQMVDVNLKGVLYGVAAVLPQMLRQKRGHIINISSVLGRKAVPGAGVYCATKFGVAAFSDVLRMELAATSGIRVTTIEPGAVATELTNTITDEAMREGTAHIKQRMRLLDAQDIARSILYALNQPDHVTIGEILVMPTAEQTI